MSTDNGQNPGYPVQPSDDTQPERAAPLLESVAGSQSRRKFLRAAVMSGVAVASVGATAGIAAACEGKVPVVLGSTSGGNQASGPLSCSMCFESSALNGSISSFKVSKSGSKYNTQPGTFYVWFTAHNVPNGKYVITIENSTTTPATSLATAPFQYQSGGNNAFLYQRSAGKAADCPDYSKTGKLPGDEKRNAGTVPGLFSNPTPGPYQVTGGPVDLQVTAHISWQDTSPLPHDTKFTFTGKIFSSTDLVNPLKTCTVDVWAYKNY